MPGEGKERFYAILNIGLLLGACFSLVAFSSIKNQYASEIQFPERGEALVYDPLVHHFGVRDAWKIIQRFVSNEPPPVTAPPVTNDTPLKKEPTTETKSTPSRDDKDFGNVLPPLPPLEPPAKPSEEDQRGANNGPAPRIDPSESPEAKFFDFLTSLSFDEEALFGEMKIKKTSFNGTPLFALTEIRYLGAQGVQDLFTIYLEPNPSAKTLTPVGYNEGSPISNGKMGDVPMDKFDWLKSTLPTVITDRPQNSRE
jgi:hypothetical protein